MAVKASATITLSFMVDVKAVFRYYKLQASTASAPAVPTTATPSGWTETEPTYTEGSTNTLYTVDKTVFTDDSFVYSAVSKSTAYEAAKTAYNKAVAANTAATNASDKVDNLEIGGRNLLRDTAGSFTDTWWNGDIVKTIGQEDPDGGNNAVKLSAKYSNGTENFMRHGGYKTQIIKEVGTYTFSVWMKASVARTVNISFNSRTVVKTCSLTTSWQRFVLTGNVSSIRTTDHVTLAGWSSWTTQAGDIYYYHPKFEKGDKATDWTPAPEDVDASITSAKTFYGTCTTSAAASAKVSADVTGFTADHFVAGTQVAIKFTNANTVANPTLNINNLGAKTIYRYGTTAPSTSSTSSWNAGSVVTFTYDGTSWLMNGWLNDNSNTYDRVRYQQNIKAGTTDIVAGNLIVAGANGAGTYTHLKLGSAFDITYPILYAGSAISTGSTGTNNYYSIPFTVTTTQNVTLATYKAVYIKGTLSGTTFTPISTTPLTQIVPTSEDGYDYILLGTAYSTTAMYLQLDHPIYKYYNGVFKTYAQMAADNANSANTKIDAVETDAGIDSTSAYCKYVPSNAQNYACVEKLGGMSRKSKNLIPYPYSYTTRTINGITFTDNGDGTVTANGTTDSSSSAVFWCAINNTKLTGTYKVVGAPNVDGCFIGGAGIGNVPYNSAGVFKYNDTNVTVALCVSSGKTVNNAIFKPMLTTDTSVTYSDYEPYTDQLIDAKVDKIESVGTNIWCETNSKMQSIGMVSNRACQYFYGPDVYTFSHTGGNVQDVAYNVYVKSTNTNKYSSAKAVSTGFTETVSSDEILIIFGSSGMTVATFNGKFQNAQLERSSSATQYTPYVSHTTTLPQSLRDIDGYGVGINESVYNYVDFEPVVYRNMKSVDLGSLTWYYKTNFFYCYDIPYGKILCGKYNYIGDVTDANMVNYDKVGATNYNKTDGFKIRDTAYSHSMAFKNSLNGVILHYEASDNTGEDYEAKLFHKRVGSVDLGSLSWSKKSDGIFYANASGRKYASGNFNMTSSKYATITASHSTGSNIESLVSTYGNGLYVNSGSATFYIADSSYTDTSTFKTAMSGVTLYYELASEQILDVTDMISDENFLEVEAGGTVTFNSQNGCHIKVPSNVHYLGNATASTLLALAKSQAVKNSLNENVDAIREEILQQYNNITSEYDEFISESLKEYVTTDSLGETTYNLKKSILDQTADDISIKFDEAIKKTNGVETDMNARFTQLSKWIKFDSDTAITIGSSNSAVTLEIDNTKGIIFKKNGVQFGYWDGNDFHTGNIVVDVNERAQFGNFAYVPRSDGSLSLLKIK